MSDETTVVDPALTVAPEPPVCSCDRTDGKFRLLVCGSRQIADQLLIGRAIRDGLTLWGKTWDDVYECVHGDARGVDRTAGRIAQWHHVPLTKFTADWSAESHAAGSIRNQAMADYLCPAHDWVIALPFGLSIGTWDMARRAKARGLNVFVRDLTTR